MSTWLLSVVVTLWATTALPATSAQPRVSARNQAGRQAPVMDTVAATGPGGVDHSTSSEAVQFNGPPDTAALEPAMTTCGAEDKASETAKVSVIVSFRNDSATLEFLALLD